MKEKRDARVILQREALQEIYKDVYCRREIEACGVLLGKMDETGKWWVEEVRPLENIFASPVYFEFAPEELLEVELTHPGEVVGVYHSHPTGYAMASDTDRQNMKRVNQEEEIPWVWLIVCGPFNEGWLEEARAGLTTNEILAYHHYAGRGLRKVTIEVEQ